MNIIKFLAQKLVAPAQTISRDQLDVAKGNEDNTELLKKFGIVTTDLRKAIEDQTLVMYEQCIRGDTQISLLDGTTPTIKEMADNVEQYVGKSVLSVNPTTRSLEPDTIVGVKKTVENAELVRVHLDNEQYVDCTPDHRFMTRDCSYKEAQDLVHDDSLMPLYAKMTTTDIRGYPKAYDPRTGVYKILHRLVVKFVNGKVGKGYAIHHVDFNKLNADPLNLKVMSNQEHKNLHGKHSRGKKMVYKNPALRIKNITEATQKACKTEHFRAQQKESVSRLWQDPEYREKQIKAIWDNRRVVVHDNTCVICGEIFRSKGNRNQTCGSKECRYKLISQTQSKKIKKVCLVCETIFEVSPSRSDQKYCSQSCANKVTTTDRWVQKKELVLNHKVDRVEQLDIREDTYDIQTERNHNFPLSVGIFVHNSQIYQTVDRSLNHP